MSARDPNTIGLNTPFVTAASAVGALNHYCYRSDWGWYLALNRLGKTANCPCINFTVDQTSVLYRVEDLAAFIHSEIAPHMSMEHIVATIQNNNWDDPRFNRHYDAELDSLLAKIGSDDKSPATGEEGSQSLGVGDDAILNMNEDFLMDYLCLLDRIGAEQNVCSSNLVVMASLFEAIVQQQGTEKFPQHDEFSTFFQSAVQHAKNNVRRINRVSQLLESKAYLDPNAIIPQEWMENGRKPTNNSEIVTGELA